MPYEWQKLLLLRHVKDMTLLEIANRVGKTEEEVDRIIEYARQYLRQELMEAGCVLEPRARAEHVR
jgi:DNA-directed RNA polymerase specialized sigma24 family protein